jgi:hypothetical protein
MKILELAPGIYVTRLSSQEEWIKYNTYLENHHPSDCHMAQKPDGDIIVTSMLVRESADVMGHSETFTCWRHTFLSSSVISQLF